MTDRMTERDWYLLRLKGAGTTWRLFDPILAGFKDECWVRALNGARETIGGWIDQPNDTPSNQG